MEYGYCNFEKIVVARLDRDDDLLLSIQEIIKNEDIKQGIILGAYGSLLESHMHMTILTTYPSKQEFFKMEGPLEILALQGIIANKEVHAHMVLSNKNGTYGGHLEEGCKVCYLAELSIATIGGATLVREPHPELRSKLLKIKAFD